MTHTCIECGTEFQPKKATAQFCSAGCRKSFNNRRMTRGAALYDAFMALRYDRGWAKAIGLWQLICRLAMEWKREDENAGRASYVRPDRWVQENRAWLRSQDCGVIRIGHNAHR